MKHVITAIVGIVSCGLAYAHSFELAGLLDGGKANGVLVVIHDSSSKENSRWLRIGDEWRSYKVTALATDRSSVTLKKGNEHIELYVRQSRVQDGGSSVPSLVVPEVIKGTFTLADGKLVYSKDAVVKFGPFVLSTIDGQMESDGVSIRGNLQAEGPNGTVVAAGATVHVKKGKPVFTAKKMHYVKP